MATLTEDETVLFEDLLSDRCQWPVNKCPDEAVWLVACLGELCPNMAMFCDPHMQLMIKMLIKELKRSRVICVSCKREVTSASGWFIKRIK